MMSQQVSEFKLGVRGFAEASAVGSFGSTRNIHRGQRFIACSKESLFDLANKFAPFAFYPE